MARRHLWQGGMVLAGIVAGGVLALALVLLYLRLAADAELAERVLREIDLPASVFELEELEGDSMAVVSAEDVLVRSTAGDTIVAAPSARLRIRLTSLAGEGPIVADEVRLRRPFVNFVQSPDGEVNLTQAMVVTAGGEEVGNGEGGRPIELRDVRLEDARVRVLTPYLPDSTAAEDPDGLRLVRRDGALMRERWARNLSGRLTRIRFGGGEGWQVEVGALAATLTDPEVSVRNLAGFARQGEGDAIAFGIREFRTDASTLEGSGTVRFAEEGLALDVDVTARPLAFEDLRWFVPRLPAEGIATGQVAVSGGPGGRYALSGTGVEVTVGDSRMSGFFAAEVGGGAPAVFGETRIAVDPLSLETVRALGFGAELPYVGEIRGVVSSPGGELAGGQRLNLDLSGTFAPERGDVSPSTVIVQGPVSIGEEMELRFEGVRAGLQPLYLAALRPLAEENAERLRGVARGSALITGSPDDLRIADGSIEYQVGNAPATTLTELDAVVTRDPELAFEISARAQPIALGTVAELFPAMPFRTARFSGPIRIAGTMDRIDLDAELAGAAGSIAARGVVSPGTPLRFDLAGEVAAFNAEAVLTRPVPVEGPVTGSFAVDGSTEAFGFEVDLRQDGTGPNAGGTFALAGSFEAEGEAPPLIRVGGEVANFNLGAVIGRPRLFPSRMTGRIDVQGGGTRPYQFDVDLRGEAGVFDVNGYFAAGDVPLYAASGRITGLDLRQLPGMQTLPATSLQGTVDLEGQGTTLETLAGRLRFNAVGSTVGGTPLDRLDMDVAVEDGVLVVQSLSASLATTQLTAEGRLGLTRPATGAPLQIRAASSDLSRLAPLASGITGLPPRLTGSFLMQAQVTGSVEAPELAGVFRGQQLRYEGYRAERLEMEADLDIADGFREIEGQLELAGSRLMTPGLSLDSLAFAAQGSEDSMTVRGLVRREPGSDVRLAGVMEMVDRVPSGVLLDSLQLRAGTRILDLRGPAEVRWGGVEGIRVANLVLVDRTDPYAYIRVDGSLPPTGATDLRGEVRRIDLGLLAQLLPDAPDLAGIVDLDFVVEGSTGDPRLFAQGYGTGMRYQDVALDSISLFAQYEQGVMSSRAGIWQGALQVAAAEAEIPMTLTIDDATPEFELRRDAPLNATIRADSLPLALLTAATEMVTDGAGSVAGQLDLEGSVGDPQLSGFASIRNGGVTVPQLGRRLDRISGHIILDQQQIVIDTLVAYSGGRAELNGSVRVTDLERPELYLTATFDGFHAIDNEQIANLTMSGNVQLQGVMPQPVLTGSVRLQEGAIYIPSLNEQAPLEIANIDVGQVGVDTAVAAAVGPSALEQIRISGLDVAVDEGVWLESDEANVQIRGDLVLIRTGAAMQMFGTLEAVRGTYDLPIGPLLREFDVVAGSVRFLGTPDFNPDIDITAEHRVRAGTSGGSNNLAVLVRLTGTLQNPSIELTSNTQPPLPESELLSWLVFGQPSFRLQGTGALANQLVVQELVGGLLSRQLGDLGLPCEYFRLRGRPNILNTGGGDPLGSTSVECGVQLLEDVFLTVETGILPSLSGSSGTFLGSLLGVSLDWQVNDRVTATVAREPVQSALGTLYITQTELPYQFSADVRGTWEFGRPSQSELPVPALEAQEGPTPQQAPVPQQEPEPPDAASEADPPLPGRPVEEPEAEAAEADPGDDGDAEAESGTPAAIPARDERGEAVPDRGAASGG